MLTKRTLIIWGTVGVLLTCAGTWWWLETSATPPPVVPVVAPAPVAKLPPKPKEVVPPEKPLVPEVTPPQTVLTAGNLGKVTDIKGRIEVLKLEVQEEELKQKKKVLSTSVTPPVVATTPKFPELDLPAFTPPSSKSTPRTSSRASGTAVIAVHGVDGDLRAIVRTSTGTSITVRKGTSFGGGIISDISRQGVMIRKNNTVTALPFE